MDDHQLTAEHSALSPPWFLAQIKPNAGSIAKRNLLRQGVQVFEPYEEVASCRGQQFVRKSRALFPGYLFVHFDPDEVRWRAINSTLGVSRLVSFSEDCPAQVPLSLISSLMARCDPSGKLLPPSLLNRGDLVSVTGGPLADFVGTVERLAPEQRVWVLLDILGKRTRVAVRLADLRRVG